MDTPDVAYRRRGRCLAFENDIPRVVSFGDHPDDLVVIDHDQRPHIFFGHFCDGVEDGGARVDGQDFPTFLLEQLPHRGHVYPPTSVDPKRSAKA
jgi:hypothetical protein